MNFEEFVSLIEAYKRTKNDGTIELKLSIVDNLILSIQQLQDECEIYIAQKLNLIIKLQELGVTDEEIAKLIDVIKKDKKLLENKKD